MTYHVDFSDATDAAADLGRVDVYHRRAIEDALADLEERGPCIGERLRGSGLDQFCRTPVRIVARHPWRIVYRWPSADPDDPDLIEVFLIGQEGIGRDDVYLRLEEILRSQQVDVGGWDASIPKRRCCDEASPHAPIPL